MSDPHAFRNALGQFATGVTVVTTTTDQKEPVGVTASSFNSVSLEPPLILWSLAKTAKSMAAFKTSGGFNVHVLASHQTDISNKFARADTDKFEGVEWQPCAKGFPVLSEYSALFRCRTHFQYEGGDHIIFVGEVEDYQTHDLPSLVFHGGRYADARHKSPSSTPSDPAVDLSHGRFSDDFLLYLISRAHFQTSLPTRKACRSMGMDESEYFCLSLLAMSDGLTEVEMVERLDHTGHEPEKEIFARLLRKDLMQSEGEIFRISENGRQTFIKLLSLSKSLEEQLVKHFTDDELGMLRRVLKKLIKITGEDVPELW